MSKITDYENLHRLQYKIDKIKEVAKEKDSIFIPEYGYFFKDKNILEKDFETFYKNDKDPDILYTQVGLIQYILMIHYE